MNLVKTPLLTLTSIITLGTAASMPLGCDGSESKSKTPTETAFGGSTQVNTAGAPGLGGAAGATAMGGTTSLPEITCTSDLECKAASLLCNKTTGKCVQCLQEADCATSTTGNICDATNGKCVACVTASDCPNPATSECVAHACVTAKTCVNSLDCTTASAPVCNRTTSRCVECVDAADCSASGKANPVCVANACQASCTTNDDCTGGTVCNTVSTPPAYCVECLSNGDCAEGSTCASGKCVIGGSSACAGTTAKPCTAIPAFTGTQVVDGYADDFCSVPGFVLGFDSSAAKINVSGGETAGATYPEKATYRVAWSADKIHVHIEVVDPGVAPNSGEIWNGDAVEFMISTSSTLTGLTESDANTLHVIGNSTMGVTVKASGSSGNHTPITDPNQFKAITTSQGYAIELQMPWPSGATVASGTAMYFDAAINSARVNSDKSVYRNAQAILFQAANTTSTSCTGTGNDIAPFCDDRLWCPTKFQ